MRVLVHDFSGHPFQVELSRELARRGHEVTHSYCPAWVSGKGSPLEAEPGVAVRAGRPQRGRREAASSSGVLVEALLGWELLRQVRRRRPTSRCCRTRRSRRWWSSAGMTAAGASRGCSGTRTCYAVAIKAFAGEKLGRGFRLVAGAVHHRRALGLPPRGGRGGDRRLVRRRARRVGYRGEDHGDPELGAAGRDRPGAAAQRLVGRAGPRRRPDAALLRHARAQAQPGAAGRARAAVRDAGTPVQLVVVNEGPAE